VIVADGGSSDETVRLLIDYSERYPELKWLSESDDGPADAVNKGLNLATGEIIGIQSSDDLYLPNAFNRVASVMLENDDCGLLYGDVVGTNDRDEVLYTNRYPAFSWESYFARSMTLQQGSIFFRASLAKQIGGWSGRYYSCDVEYWMRLIFRTKPIHVPEALSAWRHHGAMRTSADQSNLIWRDYWKIIDESSDIAMASPKIKRLAEASKHLLVLRFPPELSQFVMWRHLLVGAILHPSYWRYNHKRMLLKWLPWHRKLERILRLAKRTVLGESEKRKLHSK
jgi:glycosyltransferase involved in cell wall biosynthesis